MISIAKPLIGEAEKKAVAEVLDSGMIANGAIVTQFENEFAAYLGAKYAVATTSGTTALEVALRSLGIGNGDKVLTTPFSFIASTNAILYTGATPVLVDSTPEGDIDVELTRRAVAEQRDKGRNVVAIVPVDLLGHVVDQEGLGSVADEFGLRILNDAAESLGAVHRGRPAAAYGDLAAVSFNGNKVITTSGGGAVLTDDAEHASHIRYLATQARQPVLHYEHTDVGYNYRMSNLLAALGRSQLERLPRMLERRRQHRLFYRALFDGVPGVTFFGQPDGSEHPIGQGDHDNFWLTSVVIDPQVAGFSRDDVIKALADDNIESRPLWKPMHLQPVFRHLDAYVNGNSERLFANGVSLPSGSALDDAAMKRVAESLRTVIGGSR